MVYDPVPSGRNFWHFVNQSSWVRTTAILIAMNIIIIFFYCLIRGSTTQKINPFWHLILDLREAVAHVTALITVERFANNAIIISPLKGLQG